jgi:hypothetical protein
MVDGDLCGAGGTCSVTTLPGGASMGCCSVPTSGCNLVDSDLNLWQGCDHQVMQDPEMKSSCYAAGTCGDPGICVALWFPLNPQPGDKGVSMADPRPKGSFPMGCCLGA